MSLFLSFAAGLVCGVLSGFGIGGGTLLVLYMMYFTGIGQHTAQGINLVYFLPASAAALLTHIKNRLVDFSVAVPAVIAGAAAAVLSSIAASAIDTGLLRKLFGAFLIVAGLRETFGKHKKT